MKYFNQVIGEFRKVFLLVFLLLLSGDAFSQPATLVTTAQTNTIYVNVQIRPDLDITNVLSVKPDEVSLRLLHEATSNHTLKDVALLMLGAFVGLAASFILHKLQIKQKGKEDEEFKKNVMRAIRSEVESLKMIYEKGIGLELREIEKHGFFPITLSLTEEWFTVFNANAAHLGKIEKEMSNQIIVTYALNKALIETFRINNYYLAEMKCIGFEIQQRGMQPDLKDRSETVQGWLSNQASKIRNADIALRDAVANLFKALDERGIK